MKWILFSWRFSFVNWSGELSLTIRKLCPDWMPSSQIGRRNRRPNSTARFPKGVSQEAVATPLLNISGTLNRANGMSDIEGKAARVAAMECG